MGLSEVMHRIAAAEAAGADLDTVRAVLTDISMVERWAVQQRLMWHARLCALAGESPSIVPEQIHAQVSGRSQREADRDTERTVTLAGARPIGEELAAGSITVDHLDVLTAASARLEPEQRTRLLGDASLAIVARNSTPEQFRDTLEPRIRSLLLDDGVTRLSRQRRAVALRTWIDRVTGMVAYRGELDPDTGSRFLGRLDAKVAELFHDRLPDTAPSDPVARQDHLRGLALLALTETGGSGSGAVETIVVIDQATLAQGWHPGSIVEHPHDGIVGVQVIHRLVVGLFR